MLVTAGVVALILVILGEFLTTLLHFSTGALSVAGGIVLLIIAVTMVLGPEDSNKHNPTIGVLALVFVIDIGVFRFANRVSQHLDESRLLVTEKVFGFLLAALAVQLILNGLSDVGAIHLTAH
jgi:multiple antibiotic resistance protein